VRGHALLEQAAITAVKQWRYEPLALNGEPVPFILTVTLNFTIPR
jgi:periplasmic protein TonB